MALDLCRPFLKLRSDTKLSSFPETTAPCSAGNHKVEHPSIHSGRQAVAPMVVEGVPGFRGGGGLSRV